VARTNKLPATQRWAWRSECSESVRLPVNRQITDRGGQTLDCGGFRPSEHADRVRLDAGQHAQPALKCHQAYARPRKQPGVARAPKPRCRLASRGAGQLLAPLTRWIIRPAIWHESTRRVPRGATAPFLALGLWSVNKPSPKTRRSISTDCASATVVIATVVDGNFGGSVALPARAL
jgi:hypothetical protein